MAITRVQQSQISGSLQYSDSASVGSGMLGQSTLAADLNNLRALLKDIKGEGAWYDGAAQDLAKVHAAMVATGTDAAFQGAISSVGAASIGGGLDVVGAAVLSSSLEVKGASTLVGAASLSSTLAVAGKADFAAAVEVQGTSDLHSAVKMYSTVEIDGAATLNSTLDVTGKATVGSLESLGVSKLDSLEVVHAAVMDSTLDVVGAAVLSSSLEVKGAATMQNGLTVNAAVADFNAGITANEIKIDGDTVGALYLVGASGEIQDSNKLSFDGSKLSVTGGIEASGNASVGGTLGVTGAATFSAAASVGGNLSVQGTSGLHGDVTMDGALSVAGGTTLGVLTAGASTLDSLSVTNAAEFSGAATFHSNVEISVGALEITGSFAIQGDSALDGALSVSGIASFGAAITGSAGMRLGAPGLSTTAVKIDGDQAGRLYIVDTDGSIKDEGKLNFASDKLSVTGDFDVSGAAEIHGNAKVDGTFEAVGAATLDSTLDVTGAADFLSTLHADGAASFGATLSVTGAATLNSTLDVTDNAHFMGNVQVDGDLRVKGAMTYIDTQNMRVQDAFIYLATGSAGTTDSGIVLHGGAGANMDLVIGQDAGNGEVIFGKGNRAPDGDGALAGIDLVPAWMSEVKIASVEGTKLGGVFISGSSDVAVSSGGKLFLQSGAEAFSLAAAGEQASFESQFPGKSLVAAIISAAAGGNFKQDSIVPGAKAALAAIDFSAVGSLRDEEVASDAAKKLAMDVYLNGVRLSYGADYSIPSKTEIALECAIIADDRLMIVIHNAA